MVGEPPASVRTVPSCETAYSEAHPLPDGPPSASRSAPRKRYWRRTLRRPTTRPARSEPLLAAAPAQLIGKPGPGPSHRSLPSLDGLAPGWEEPPAARSSPSPSRPPAQMLRLRSNRSRSPATEPATARPVSAYPFASARHITCSKLARVSSSFVGQPGEPEAGWPGSSCSTAEPEPPSLRKLKPSPPWGAGAVARLGIAQQRPGGVPLGSPG
jgi:hypothetical protein